jgi:hypothetical protein
VRRPSAALNGAKSARGLAHSKTLARKVQVDEFAPAERTIMDSSTETQSKKSSTPEKINTKSSSGQLWCTVPAEPSAHRLPLETGAGANPCIGIHHWFLLDPLESG